MTELFEVLAVFETIAIFEGYEHIPCHFMTALCPDKCGHAKDVAKFKIVEYLKYEKPGEYGDSKSGYFSFDINPNAESDRQNIDIINKVKELKVGDKVKLCWNHIYLTGGIVHRPERRVLLLEKQ